MNVNAFDLTKPYKTSAGFDIKRLIIKYFIKNYFFKCFKIFFKIFYLTSSENYIIQPKNKCVCKTGLKMEIPKKSYGRIGKYFLITNIKFYF